MLLKVRSRRNPFAFITPNVC